MLTTTVSGTASGTVAICKCFCTTSIITTNYVYELYYKDINNIIGKKMPAIITEKFRQSNATAFSNDISTSKYYMFLGKSQTWESEGSSSDTQPPDPIDSVAPESYYWDDMLASKLISSKSFVIPRRLVIN